jgi:tetratricopeptide (TPR) repeat protein
MKRVVAFLLLLLAVPAVAAVAQNPSPLFELYAQGRYDEAARAGETAHTAYGYAVAARAVLADAVLRETPCLECLQRAEKLARAAVAADAKLAEGQVWLAVSLGYQARIKGVLWARWNDLPGQAKTALQAAVAAEPDNPYAVSAFGGWQVEVVKAGGPFLARQLYGANLAEAMSLFDRAVRLAPDNVAVRYQIALSLAGLDPVAHRGRILAELDAATRDAPVTAYEKRMQGRAGDLKTAMAGDRVRLDAVVRKFQGYP